MDLLNDEPRKHPQPVPFCKSDLLQPTVPEVSLLLQDDFNNPTQKKNDFFSGTEFQTYNAWKWKNFNLNDKKLSSDFKKANRCTSAQDSYLIKDKYSSSDIEKRKNEILYGDFDEPRRPLPPRPNPLVPKSNEFFSDLSFEDQPVSNVCKKHPNAGVVNNQNILGNSTVIKSFENDVNNSEKLYSIIQEQNKQMEVLHKQIEQLLKLEEVKDKQIEQLLNAQESKEKKIEHLLQSLELKDKEVEHLLKLKEKQEQHFQELLKSQEQMQRENLNLINKLKEKKEKNVQSVGVMTQKYVIDASSNTSFDCCNKDKTKNEERKMGEEESSVLRDNNESSKLDEKEKSLSLHSSDLPIIQEHVPSPQSSIHVDMQDFPDSSEESDNESVIASKIFPSTAESPSSGLGYTFYNNVLTQVKDIIQKSNENKTNTENLGEERILDKKVECNLKPDSHETMHSFHAWGVIGTEKILPPNFDQEKILERNIHSSPEFCLKNPTSPSDISLKINALAMKYLKHEQISQNEVQNPYQHDVTIYNVTNLSFGSMRYLDRYQMLPANNSQKGVFNIQQKECSPSEFLRKKKMISVQENITSFGNILDINTLHQQPKLL